MTTQLAFHNTHFDIVDRNGQPWLRSPQIAEALGYSQANRVSDVYSRHADEFTDSMTAVIKLPSSGGEQDTRIFSLRGAHLLAMLSRTKVAKEFRRWVLDVLDSLGVVAAHSEGLTPAQQRQVQKAVNQIVHRNGVTHADVYRGIKDRFQVGSYRDVPQEQFAALVAFLDGGPQRRQQPVITHERTVPAMVVLDASWLMANNRGVLPEPVNGKLFLRAQDVARLRRSPLDEILSLLSRQGHDVSAAIVEYDAMRYHLRSFVSAVQAEAGAVANTYQRLGQRLDDGFVAAGFGPVGGTALMDF